MHVISRNVQIVPLTSGYFFPSTSLFSHRSLQRPIIKKKKKLLYFIELLCNCVNVDLPNPSQAKLSAHCQAKHCCSQKFRLGREPLNVKLHIILSKSFNHCASVFDQGNIHAVLLPESFLELLRAGGWLMVPVYRRKKK